MKHIISFPRALAAAILCWFLPQACQAQVIINEVFWSGSDLSTADEWLELRNTGTGDVLLSGWSLTSLNSKGQMATMVRFATGTLIGSSQHLLIANYPAATSRLAREPDLVTTGLSLPNTKLLLRLLTASGTVVDQADDGVGVPMAGRNDSKPWGRASMERIDPLGPGDLPASWRTASTFSGFDDGARLYGTPGSQNGSGETDDRTPPLEAEDLHATLQTSATGCVMTVTWKPSVSLDLVRQIVTVEAGGTGSVVLLPATRTAQIALPLSASGYVIRLVSVDDLGNRSAGVTAGISNQSIMKSVQDIPLHRGTIRISEILSNPVGSDDQEWIELHNTGTGAETLTGYTLTVSSKVVGLGRLQTILQSGGYLVVRASVLGLSLPNSGGSVELAAGDHPVQQFTVAEMPEGVAYGSLGTGSLLQPLCGPTPGAPNELRPPNPQLTLQSGTLQGEGRVTINLQMTASSGSLAGATCSVDYGDGTVVQSCNPPSHSITRVGKSTIRASVTDYCGTTVLRTMDVDVAAGGSVRKLGVAASRASASLRACVPQTATGVRVSEVLSAPSAQQHEWIELENQTDGAIDLCGWQLDDEEGGSHPFWLDGFSVLARAFLVLDRSQTTIAVNDSGDQVRLIAPAVHTTATGSWLTHSGGTLVQALPVPAAHRGESWAANGSGVFLWSPIPTPGSSNVFPQPLSPIVSQELDLVATPNPAGRDDADEEVIGIGVTGSQVIDLTGWELSDATGKRSYVLDMTRLAPGEYRWLRRRETGLILPNTHGVLRLFDREHRLVTVLGWRNAAEGQSFHSFLSAVRLPSQVLRVDTQGNITLRQFQQHRSELLATHENTVPLFGVDTGRPEWMEYLRQDMEHPQTHRGTYEYYSSSLISSKTGALLFLRDGEVAAYRILRLGLATVSREVEQSDHAETLLAYEADARQARRGLWADEAFAHQVDVQREEEDRRRTVAHDGFTITLEPEPGLLPMTGGTVKITTNIPAAIAVAVNSGSFVTSSGSVRIDRDSLLHVRAQAAIGQQELETTTSGTYVLKRKDYHHTLIVSEVYPAPGKAMNAVLGNLNQEWVEVQNLTNQPQNLAGWQLDDATDGGSPPRTLPSSLVVPPRGYVVLPTSLTKISFSNSGDRVVLTDPNGNSEQFDYPKITSTKSVVLKHGHMCVSDVPSPGSDGPCIVLAQGAAAVDSDGDTLPDDAERSLYKLDPHNPDTDGDGWGDGFEVYAATMKGSVVDLYPRYLLNILKPKWHLTKTKGLVLNLRIGPIKAVDFTIQGTDFHGSFTRRKSGSLEASVVGELVPGEYVVSLDVTDILNKKVELNNAFIVHLKQKYLYYGKTKIRVRQSTGSVFRYALPAQNAERSSSILRRLQDAGHLGLTPGETWSWIVILSGLFSASVAAWYTRKRWLSE